MCKQFTLLVEQSDWRYVAQCEHGTVHLRWGHVTMSLSPTDFLALAHMVLDEYAAETPITGRLRLNVNNVALEFAADDFHPLLALLQQAVSILQSDASLQVQPGLQPAPFLITKHLN